MGRIVIHPDTVHSIAPIVFNHLTVPSYEDCLNYIRDLASRRWEAAGKPEGVDLDIWLLAEFILFGPDVKDGYRIWVMDKSKPLEAHQFYYHCDAVIVTPQGPKIVNGRTWR